MLQVLVTTAYSGVPPPLLLLVPVHFLFICGNHPLQESDSPATIQTFERHEANELLDSILETAPHLMSRLQSVLMRLSQELSKVLKRMSRDGTT